MDWQCRKTRGSGAWRPLCCQLASASKPTLSARGPDGWSQSAQELSPAQRPEPRDSARELYPPCGSPEEHVRNGCSTARIRDARPLPGGTGALPINKSDQFLPSHCSDVGRFGLAPSSLLCEFSPSRWTVSIFPLAQAALSASPS